VTGVAKTELPTTMCTANPRLHGAALAAILATAALLRLGWPGIHTYGYDEARLSQLALETVRNGRVATVGIQSSAGLPNFPASVWIMALPYALSTDPLVASLFVGLLNVAAVAGVWWLAHSAWGPWPAAIAALGYAASPFGAFYSRAVWTQDLLGPLAVAWAMAAVHGIARGRLWALALQVFLCTLAPQVHFAGAALLVPTAWLLVRYRLWHRWGTLLAGVAPAALASMPWVWALSRSDVGMLGALSRAAQPEAVSGPLTGLVRLLEMTVGRGWEWFLLGEAWRWAAPGILALSLSQGLMALLLLAGTAALVRELSGRESVRGEEARLLAGLLPFWALASPLLFGGHLTPAYHQYQLVSLPALFLLAGYGARLLARRWWPPILTLALLLAAIPQATAFATGLNLVAAKLTPGGIGTPLAYPRAAARALREGGEVILHAHGDEGAYSGDVAGFSVLLWDHPHRVVDGRWALLTPADQASSEPAHLFFTFPDLAAAEVADVLGVGEDRRQYPRRAGEPPYVSLRASHADDDGWIAIDPVRLANGAELIGWRAERRGEALRVYTRWRIINGPASVRYHQFHHLRTAPEGEPDQVHDVPISSPAWRRGDTLIVWADFPAPAASAWVDVGMYTWPDLERSAVLDREGDPLAAIRLGPIEPAE